jgi:hypothetical protein
MSTSRLNQIREQLRAGIKTEATQTIQNLSSPRPDAKESIREQLRASIQAETNQTIQNLSLQEDIGSESIAPPVSTSKCGDCQETLDYGAKFCPNCGSKQASVDIDRQLTGRSAAIEPANLQRTVGASGNAITSRRSSMNDLPQLPRRAGSKALCIGMGKYARSPLPWPHKDAEDLSLVLAGLGYEVNLIINTNFEETMSRLGEFIQTIEPGDDIVYTYSGHGCGVDVIPNLTALDSESMGTLINVYKILIETAKFKQAKSVVVAIDACRGNEYSTIQYPWEAPAEFSQIAEKSLGARNPEDEFGFAIIYGTSHDTSAYDSPFSQGIQNGLFSYFLKSEISRPGQSLTEIHRRVQQSVMDLSLGLESEGLARFQKPALTNEIAGEYYFYPVT